MIQNSSVVYIITKYVDNHKIIKCYKNIHHVFRPYASGGVRTFLESEIKFIANSIEELKEIAPEYFI